MAALRILRLLGQPHLARHGYGYGEDVPLYYPGFILPGIYDLPGSRGEGRHIHSKTVGQARISLPWNGRSSSRTGESRWSATPDSALLSKATVQTINITSLPNQKPSTRRCMHFPPHPHFAEGSIADFQKKDGKDEHP